MHYEFQLDLQQKTALNAAISFWEKPAIKNEASEFLEDNRDELEQAETIEQWKELIEQMIEDGDQPMLSPKLKGEWIHIVNNLGDRIYNWYVHVEISEGFPFGAEGDLPECTDKISWTSHGTINELELFKSYLSTQSNLNLIKIYGIACSYALEEQITDLWGMMSEDEKDYCDDEIDEYHTRHLLAYWKYRRDNNQSDLLKYFEKIHPIRSDESEEYDFQYKPDLSPEENMVWVSIHDGFSTAVEYFWNKSSQEVKDKHVGGLARLAVCRYQYYVVKQSKYYKKDQYVDIWRFLMNQMTGDQRKLFFSVSCSGEDQFNDGKNVLMMLVSSWPWQELLIPVLNDMKEGIKDDNELLSWCLDLITEKMHEDYMLDYAVQHGKYQSLFQAVWSWIPRAMKPKVFEDSRFLSIMNVLLEVWDLESLKLILNDPEAAEHRGHVIEAGKKGLLKLILDDKYDLLDQLVKEVFKTDAEKSRFKKEINIWSNSGHGRQFYTAETLYKYRKDQHDGVDLEGGIDDVELCRYFGMWKRYESVEKFIKWKFETEEERQRFRELVEKKK